MIAIEDQQSVIADEMKKMRGMIEGFQKEMINDIKD